MKPAIVVLGSLNMDFVVRVPLLPVAGETVLGAGFQMIPGGKGANQACAAGKLSTGTPVRMLGRVGYDVFGDHLKASLAAAGVDIRGVSATRSEPTGVALISVDGEGQNSIVVAPGANSAFLPNEIEACRSFFHQTQYALFQLETPLATVSAALEMARSEGARTLLDPAPAQALSRELLSRVNILTPNENEACQLIGRAPARVAIEEARTLARMVLALGPGAVVLKLGNQGCLFVDSEQEVHVPAFPVEVVDATAAGDTFNAALAIALTEELPIEGALRFANAAAAMSVTKLGAQASVPSRAEVNAMLVVQ